MMAWAKSAVLTTAFVAAVSSGGRAQGNDLQAELAHCLTFSGAVERLSCYDRLAREAVRGAPQAASAPPLPAPSRADTAANRPAPREFQPRDFGKEQLPSTPLPGEDRITAEISDFRQDPTGRFTIVLSNGQVWQQSAGDTARAQYRSGGTKTVIISRGSLGSYDLAFGGRNMTFKVKRLR